MQYLFLIYSDEKAWDRMSESEGAAVSQQFTEYTQSIVKSGHLRGGDALQRTKTATTVRVKDGKTVTTDGPFAETKEQLGGYYLVEAKDKEEAILLAARIPSTRFGGCIEVRPIQPMPHAKA
jgi:hypothetical protein